MLTLDVISQNNGWTVVIVGIGVVFIALYILAAIFKLIPKLLNVKFRYDLRKKGEVEDIENKTMEIDIDTNAAISMALFLYLSEMHDEESDVITIKRLSRRYSPWSSKIYSVMNTPRKQL